VDIKFFLLLSYVFVMGMMCVVCSAKEPCAASYELQLDLAEEKEE
jgi:hypothetical protein